MKVMMIVVAAMMATMSANAQVEDLKHEIGVSYGPGVSILSDGLGYGLVNGLFDALGSRTWTNDSQFGTLALEYFYHLGDPKVAIGGIVAYSRFSNDLETDGKKVGERTRNYYTAMPAVKYYWVNGNNFGLYSKLAAGGTMLHADAEDLQSHKSDSDSKIYFGYQISALGLEAGSQSVRGFLEGGFGEQGFLLAGLKFKF